MKLIRSKILFLSFLALAPKAFAEKSCHAFFEVTRPTDAEIETTFYEMKSLASQMYSKDSTESNVARSLFNERLKQLDPFFTSREIKERLQKINLNSEIPKSIVHRNNDLVQQVQLKFMTEAFLIENGFKDVKSMNENKSYSLIVAVEQKRFELLKPLIELGAEVNKTNAVGMTALYYAANNGHIEAAKILLDHKASPRKSDEDKVTPLHAAARSGHKDIIDLLIPYGGINYKDVEGNTPLELAVERRHFGAAETLLLNKANLTIVDNLSREPFFYAARNEDIPMMNLLIQHGANIHHTGPDKITYLMSSAARGKNKSVQFLLDLGLEINAIDHENNSVLIYATKNDQPHTVKYLIENGADVNIKNIQGQTALTIALTKDPILLKNKKLIIKLLQEAGAKE